MTAIEPTIGNSNEFTCNDASSIFVTADDIELTLASISDTPELILSLANSSVVPNPCMSDCSVSSSVDAVVNTWLRLTISWDRPARSWPSTRVAAEPCERHTYPPVSVCIQQSSDYQK